MSCVCVGDMMDVVFSVCNMRTRWMAGVAAAHKTG